MLVANTGDSLETILTILEIAFVVVGVYILWAWRKGKLTRELLNRVTLSVCVVVVLVFVVVLAFRFMRP